MLPIVPPEHSTTANTTYRPNVGPMLGQRRRRRPNIGPTLGGCVVFSWTVHLLELIMTAPAAPVNSAHTQSHFSHSYQKTSQTSFQPRCLMGVQGASSLLMDGWTCVHANVSSQAAQQSQKAVTAYLISDQLLPFVFSTEYPPVL